MNISRASLTIVIAVLTCGQLAARAQSQPQLETQGADKNLAGTEWRLSSFVTPGGESPVVEGAAVTLKLGADGRAGGSGGCNTYGGEYREQGDSISFSRIISTKRACADERANQQEGRYFAALESAGKFTLAEGRLTIFHGDGRSALNFVGDSTPAPAARGYEELNGPVSLLASFYDAVNARDYARAYGYWESPPSTLEVFARGYAETASVRLIVEPPTRVEGAAGSLYSQVPTVLVSRQRDGSQRVFAGCYTTRKSNLRPTDVPKEEVWRIFKAKMTAVPAGSAIPKLLADACRD